MLVYIALLVSWWLAFLVMLVVLFSFTGSVSSITVLVVLVCGSSVSIITVLVVLVCGSEASQACSLPIALAPGWGQCSLVVAGDANC